MHLIELYARDLGVKIGKPIFRPHFFPIVDEKYIVIHNGIKVPAKTYPYWFEVVGLIRPYLDKEGILIYQIGLEEEPSINNVNKRVFTSSLKQTSFIIQNSLLMAGIDSVPIHLASCLGVKTVSLYAHTYASTCSPYWSKDGDAIILESKRGGKNPSFSLNEEPKTVSFIKPEEVAEAILKQLGIKNYSLSKTIFIGPQFNSERLDLVLDKRFECIPLPPLPKGTAIRMDLSHDEEQLAEILEHQNFEFTIRVKKPVNMELIKRFKHRIIQLVYQNNQFDGKFIEKLTALGVNFALICDSPEHLSAERLKFFENEIHYFNETELKETKKKEINIEDKDINFITKKVYVCGRQKYSNLIDLKKKLGQKTQRDDFYIDIDHMWVYSK